MKFVGILVLLWTGLCALVVRADSPVVFNEIMYHPATNEASLEWVELQNQLSVDVDLSKWSLDGGIQFLFPEGTIIRAGGYLVIASSPATLEALTGRTNIIGPFAERLSNSGERIQLRNDNRRLMDELSYGVDGDWPVAPDGAGPSLARKRANLRGSEPGNWLASSQVGGTPGVENFPDTSPRVNSNTVAVIESAWKYTDTGLDLGIAWRSASYDDTGWPSGVALFYQEDAPLPAGKNTPLTPGRTTYYFRTRFVLAEDVTRIQLALRPIVDDGAIGYLNGVEVFRINMPSGEAAYSTLASSTVGDASFGDKLFVVSNNLLPGTNVLAVEVHQAPRLSSYPQSVLNSGPVGYWRLGESAGPAMDAASASGPPQSGAQNGIYSGFLPANLVQPGPRSGDILLGKSLSGFEANNFAPRFAGNVDGGNDVVTIPDTGVFNFASNRAFSLEAWVNGTSVQESGAAIITKGTGGGGEQYAIDVVNGVYRFFGWDGGSANSAFLATSSVGPDSSWQHVVAVLDQPAGRLKIYVNGIERGSSTPLLTLINTPHEISIGARKNAGSSNYDLNFDGRIDEVAIYNRALSPNEILAHFNAAFTNSVAVGADTNDVVFGLEIVSEEALPESGRPKVAFNEMASATNSAFWLELINYGPTQVNIEGWTLTRFGGLTNREYTFPNQFIAPGQLLQVTKAQLGFGVDPGDRLVLYHPGGSNVVDAVVARHDLRGRSPDATGAWWFPTQPTPGASNRFQFHDELVINEIMYHHRELLAEPAVSSNTIPLLPFRDSPESWVEIYNRSSNVVDLAGWRLDEGIDYRFPVGKSLGPGAYLVVASDPAYMQSLYPGLDVLGPFTNKLSKSSSYLALKDPNNNLADEVRYFAGGHWPEFSDGGGSSLELRDPRADNNRAETWAASSESGASQWQTFTWRGVASAGQGGEPTLWHELALCLLDGAGEVLLDDIRVVETPATAPKQLLSNGSFNDGTSAHWRFLGNHRRSRVEPEPGNPANYVLHLVTTGPGEYQGNQLETTLTNNVAIVDGREYEISFRAKWLAGKRKLNARLYFNRLARTFDLVTPLRNGTPGAVNSRFTPNIGPTFSGLAHKPVVPLPNQPVSVSVRTSDPDGIQSLSLKYLVSGAAWQSVPMNLRESNAVGLTFSGVILGQPAGVTVQFYVEGIDALGVSSFYPPGGTNSRALFPVQDNQAAPVPLHNFRVVMTPPDASFLHSATNTLSNELLGCTVIYDESEVFYDCGVRLKGSFVGRNVARVGFHVVFDPEHPFRGIHQVVSVDRSQHAAIGSVGEIITKHIANHAGGIPAMQDDLARFIAPLPAYTSMSQLRFSGFDSDFLDAQFDNGSDGPMFEVEVIRWNLATADGNPESVKLPGNESGGTGYANLEVQNYGDSQESYRWMFLQANQRTADNYEPAIRLGKTFSLTGAALDAQATQVLDVEEWLRVMAYQELVGPADSYYTGANVHNFRIYQRPEDQKVLYLPWDWDSSFLAATTAPIFGSGNIAKLLTNPNNRRSYLNHMLDIIRSTFNNAYMSRWTTHYGAVSGQDMSGILNYITARAAYVLNQLPTAVPFVITSNNGNNFGTSNSWGTISGTAPIGIKTIEVNGTSYPITWNNLTNWTLTIPLFSGTNILQVQGVDNTGWRPGNAVDTITITNGGPGAFLPVVINEWMADNAGPAGLADPADGLFQDWFELFNPNTNAVDLSGYFLTDNFSFPTKWRIPTNTIITAKGFLLVWADNQTNQNSGLPGTDLHAAFQLSAGGEAIGLYAPDGLTPQAMVVFGSQAQNVSQGFFPDGNTNAVYAMTNFTPRAANTLATPLRWVQLTYSGSTLTLTWNSVAGRHYRVEYKDDLASSDWAGFVSSIQALGVTTSIQDTISSHRFYRVLRLD